jgi:hypothetical protein
MEHPSNTSKLMQHARSVYAGVHDLTRSRGHKGRRVVAQHLRGRCCRVCYQSVPSFLQFYVNTLQVSALQIF